MSRLFRDAFERVPLGFALFIFFLSFYLFTMSGVLQYGGETEKYRVAQSIVERLDFSIRPVATRHEIGTGGRLFSLSELGLSLVEVPLYALARAVYALFPTPDVNQIGLLFVGLLNPILTALTCLSLFRLCSSLGFQTHTALAVTVLFGLGTIAWAYSKNSDREPLLALLILWSFHAAWLFNKTESPRWLVVTGILAGYLVFTKFIQAMVLPFLAAYLAAAILARRGPLHAARRILISDAAKAIAIFFLPAILFLGIQSVYGLARFGTPYSGLAGTRPDPLSVILNELSLSHPLEAIAGLTVSLERGVFVYSPPALLFLFAWPRWYRRQPREALLLLGIVLIEFASAAFRWEWWGGPRWGPRYLVQMTPLLLVPVAALEFEDAARRRSWVWIGALLLVLGAAVQGVSLLTNERDYFDISGNNPNLLGQIDYLSHRALDSLVIYLSSTNSGFSLNPFGVLLLAIIALAAVALVRQSHARAASNPRGFFLPVALFAIQFAAFLAFITAPYPRILTARANAALVAAEQFRADGRNCEATRFALLALERGTTYQAEALNRLSGWMPHAHGDPLSAEDLSRHFLEMPEDARVSVDRAVTVSGAGALKIFVPATANARARTATEFIAVLQDQMYEVSGWMKTENVYGAGGAVLSWYEDDGAWQKPRDVDVAMLDETVGWRFFQKRITTLPTTRRIQLAAGLWNTFGAVWFDGLQLAQITRENPPSADLPTACK